MKTSHMLLCAVLLVVGVVLLSSGRRRRVPAAPRVRADDGRDDLDDDAPGSA